MSKKLHELRERHKRVIDEAQAIVDRAEVESRDLTSYEEERADNLLEESKALSDQIDRLERKPVARPNGGNGYAAYRDLKSGRTVYAAESGKSIKPLLDPEGHNLSLGRYLQALITGNWEFAEAEREYMATMGTAENSAGGYIVPPAMSAEVIDLARNQSVVLRAGARTIPMGSSDLAIARVASDPTITTKAENSAFTATSIGLDAINLVAHTIGAVVDASRELAEDGINFAELVSNTLARALAVKLDYYALRGSGSAEPLGISNHSGIGTTTSVGTIEDYTDIVGAIKDLMDSNYYPTGIVMPPAVWQDYQDLYSGDGTNAAKQPMMKPAAVAELPWYTTNQAESGCMYVADWAQALWGVRHDVRIEFTTDAGDRFNKHQIGIKATWRGDFGIERDAAFHKLSGIS